MKRRLAPVLAAAALILLTGMECPPLFDDGLDVEGTPFTLNPGIEAVTITGDPRLSDFGPFGLAFTARATGSAELRDTLPAGLLFRSERNATQHMMLLKDHIITAGPAGTVNLLGSFCCNLRRVSPDRGDTFALGPEARSQQSSHRDGLVQLAGLVRGKDISDGQAMWMVQRAVYLVTDSTGLTQAYIDSINALPPDPGPMLNRPGPERAAGALERMKEQLRRAWGIGR